MTRESFHSLRRIVVRLGLPALFLTALTTSSQRGAAQRLPAGVHPEHYTLALTPDLKAATFAGSETIDLTLDAPSRTITLNSAEIEMLSVSASGQTGTVTYDVAKEQATITFPAELGAGKVSLAIAYTGILNDKLRGFYLSKTKARNYAVTQFEATDARRAFPSFDEPALKATYDVSLTVDAGDNVIANGPLVSDRPAGVGKHTLTFGQTPKMSTYLVAFLVGDFQCEAGKADGVPIRVCGTPDKLQFTHFALEAAEYILPYYDKYFGIKYPMAKLDLIGLPDFEAGAMENFGCITYRETDLFVDKNGSIDAKKRVASVVAHEMAHQWFGDMVTMQWWDNLWLNEGFATWMSTKPIAKWHPEWNYAEDDATTLDATLNLDAQPITHAIRARETSTPDQINELFDGISYGKGGAVLGMVENYLGEEVFRQGVHNYLQAHLYGNATAEDFWNAQTANSKQPVDRIMGSFIDQPGVPLLTLNGTGVAQSRFYLSGAKDSGADQQWTIPVCVKADAKNGKKDRQACKAVTAQDASLPAAAGAPFVYANAGDHGYYRTLYTAEQQKAITVAAERALTAPERIGLIGDEYALVRAGKAKIGDFLDLVLALKQDGDATVIESTLSKLGQVRARIATGDDAAGLDALVRQQFGPVYAALGKPNRNEAYNKQELRTTLFEALGAAKDPAVLAEARVLTNEAFSGKKPADPALSDAAVNITAENGDAALYDKLQTVAENATDPGLKSDALHSLARFQAPELVLRTLDYATSGKVRNQDSWVLFAIVLQRTETQEIAWKYIQEHWKAVRGQFTTNSGVRVVGAAGSFCTVERRDEVRDFFSTHHVDAAERTLSKTVDAIDDCARRRAVEEPELRQWISQQMGR